MEFFQTENFKAFHDTLNKNEKIAVPENTINLKKDSQEHHSYSNQAYNREFLQSLSREDLEKLFMSKVLQQPVSSTSTRLSSLTSTDQISQALFIKPLPIEEKFSEKVNNCLNFTSDPSLLPNSSSYIPNIKQLSKRESKDALANNSNYITVGNLPKANSNENKLSNENHTNPTQTSFGVSLNEIVNRLSVQSHQLGMERFRRSVSPIFKKYEFLEKDKENIQNSAFKGGAVQNESFGVPHSLAKETKSNLPSSFGSGNTLLKSAKKETGSSAIAGAMRALQEKLKILEEENTQLKNSINENNKRENLSLIDNLNNRKIEEKDIVKAKETQELICLNEKIEYLIKEKEQFQKEILSKDKTEKKFKEKVKQLEVSLKEALEQIKFYKNELEIINDYCGKEKNSLNDALAAIRSKYRANVEQFQVQFQALDQERKKLKNLSIIQAKENQQLIKKIQILERSNLNNPQANLPNEEILEQLQQINHELFSKSQKTSDFRGVEKTPKNKVTEFRPSENTKSSHKRSLSDLSDKLRGRSGSKSSRKSDSAVKERLSNTFTKSLNNGEKEIQRMLSHSLTSLVDKKNNSKKEGKSGVKRSSSKQKTPQKSDKKQKNRFSHSLKNSASKDSLKKNKSLNSFHGISPNKNNMKSLRYSAKTLNEVLGGSKKPLTMHELESSPRFSNVPSPMKPKFYDKKI